MLVEHYPLDKQFEELARYFPPIDPALAKVDTYLEDEKLYRLIKKDLSKRWPKTMETGRNSTPVEVVLSIYDVLVVKRLYGYSYAETVARVSDSVNLRRFCRVDLNEVPVDTTLLRWANLIQPKTLEQFNQRIMQLHIQARSHCARAK